MEQSRRRLRVLSGQLAAAREVELSPISRAASSAPDASTSNSSSTYASATGQPTSYARVHGEPSRAPAAWREIRSVGRETLEDVLYHKAAGEGIAKVRAGPRHSRCCSPACARPRGFRARPNGTRAAVQL